MGTHMCLFTERGTQEKSSSPSPPSSGRSRGFQAERADNGERRTTQVLQLDTGEQFQALIISSCSRQLGEILTYATRHNF
jgi:hypothetical protein